MNLAYVEPNEVWAHWNPTLMLRGTAAEPHVEKAGTIVPGWVPTVAITCLSAAAAAAATAWVAGEVTAGKVQWLNDDALPVSHITWNRENLHVHPTMASPEVNRFRTSLPLADVSALRAIYDLAVQYFGADSTLSYSAVEDDETGEPLLFLTVDTHGMDIDMQLERELAMRGIIASDKRLLAAKGYHVVSIV